MIPTTETKTEMPSTTDPMGTLRHYIDCFNKGDVKAMAAACDVPMSILDGLPPHVWHGPTATEDWHRDVTVAGDREGATDYFVALGEPRHVNVTGDRCVCGRSRDHDVPSARPTGHAIRLDLYGGAPQACRRMAHNGLDLAKGTR